MKKLTLTVIGISALFSTAIQATELVDIHPVNSAELIETVKLDLAQTLQLNTVELNSVAKTAEVYLANATLSLNTTKTANTNVATIAE